MSGGVVFSPARGPAGATGPAGPAGPAGSSLATSICGQWVNEAGVFGVDTPFVLADWTDAATTGPNMAGASVVTRSVTRDALLITPTPAANAGAVNVLTGPLADGDDVCFALVAQHQGTIGTGNTHSVFAGLFEAPGADTKWVGGGFVRSNLPWGGSSSPTFGRWGSAVSIVGGAALGADTGTGAPGAMLVARFDVRLRRVGVQVSTWMAFGGGPWMPVQTAAAVMNPAAATVRAGVRVQCNVGQTFAVSLLAYKHFAGGLPANLLVG